MEDRYITGGVRMEIRQWDNRWMQTENMQGVKHYPGPLCGCVPDFDVATVSPLFVGLAEGVELASEVVDLGLEMSQRGEEWDSLAVCGRTTQPGAASKRSTMSCGWITGKTCVVIMKLKKLSCEPLFNQYIYITTPTLLTCRKHEYKIYRVLEHCNVVTIERWNTRK